jgi:transketolase
LPVINRDKYSHFNNFVKGGYTISECEGKPDITIFATGSEVSLALEAKRQLSDFSIRVVNMGCWEIFEEQSSEYRKSVIDLDSFRVSIEAGITMGWQKYTGDQGLNIGIDRYGESAPGPEVAKHLGLTVESIVKNIKSNVELSK